MLCPNCEFNNPPENKFCQNCGVFLTIVNNDAVQDIPSVSLNNEFNYILFQDIDTYRWAIMTWESNHQEITNVETVEENTPAIVLAETTPSMEIGQLEVEENTPAIALAETTPSMEVPEVEPIEGIPAEAGIIVTESSEEIIDEELEQATIAANFGPDERYQSLDPLSLYQPNFEQTIEHRVIDVCAPEPTRINTLLEQFNYQLNQELCEQYHVPSAILPYINLKEKFNNVIPKLYDAFTHQVADQPSSKATVIILEDRDKWSKLIDNFSDENTPIPQMIYWLQQTLNLWENLQIEGYAASILDISNLILDEDLTICLRRLIPDHDAENAIAHIGQMWYELFSQSGRTLNAPWSSLIGEIKAGNLTNSEQIKEQLEQIIRENQPPKLPPTIATVTPVINSEDIPTAVLTQKLIIVEDGAATHVGQRRNHNEDYYGIKTDISYEKHPHGTQVTAKGLYILCDGMGGHAGGEVASAMAVTKLQEFFEKHWGDSLPDKKIITEGILYANTAIFEINQQKLASGSGRMGTTLVMALLQDNQIAVAHVGDSRCYLLTRSQGLHQITTDHEVGQREIERGVPLEIAYSRPDSYQLTQALGPRNEEFVDPDVQFLELHEDSMLILASDGLTDHDFLESTWGNYLQPILTGNISISAGVDQLIYEGNKYNGHDNLTAIVIRTKFATPKN